MYRAPVADIAFALKHVAGLARGASPPGRFPALDDDVVEAILAEAGRFAADALAPLNRVGDREGAQLADGVVTTAPGWREAYADWCAGGWNGLAAPEAVGGQGLPLGARRPRRRRCGTAPAMAFALCPMLTMGAVEALGRARLGGAEGALSAAARLRRVDRRP